jgi:hypothetical protein
MEAAAEEGLEVVEETGKASGKEGRGGKGEEVLMGTQPRLFRVGMCGARAGGAREGLRGQVEECQAEGGLAGSKEVGCRES